MSNGCPYHHSIPSHELKSKVKVGKIIDTPLTPRDFYTNFALSFESYTRENNNRIFDTINLLYDTMMDQEGYLLAIREWLYEDIQIARHPHMLNTGMTTFFLILNGLIKSNTEKKLSEDLIYQKIIYFMGAINRNTIPSGKSYDLAGAYEVYVRQLLRESPPEGFIKNHEQKMRQLPCPILFSENGKKFIKGLIHIFCEKFPQSVTNNNPSLS